MPDRVIALGLDATNPWLLESWMDEGQLPTLAALRERGAFGLVNNIDYYRTETSWLTYLTGALPSETGEWGHVDYTPRDYGVCERSAFSFTRHPPFYATLQDQRVAVFDPPLARKVSGVQGLQVLGWGTETNQCLRQSQPPELMQQLIARHGQHPLLTPLAVEAGGEELFGYSIPSSYDVPALVSLARGLETGAQRRGAIMRDLLSREEWDFFLGVFSETHTASHLLWHLSQPHPLREKLTSGLPDDPMLSVFRAVDSAVGHVLAGVPGDVRVVLFSIYGIGANVLDLPSMLFLPELLYRWSFPGEKLLDDASQAKIDSSSHWKNAVWNLYHPRARSQLESPFSQEQANDPLSWQPANWYRPLWPTMKAFALPTYSEGLVRLNVKGRERSGIIAPEDYATACDALAEFLGSVKDEHSDRPMVREIVRTRREAHDEHGNPAPADLILIWQEETPTDTVTSDLTGALGPVPYFRTGGHCSTGFVMECAPGVTPGSRLPDMHARELTRHFLELLGANTAES